MIKILSDLDYQKFLRAVKQASDYDFSDYSDKSLKRMIAKVINDNKTDINTLVSKIVRDKDFLERVIKKVTVNTTELFRDPQVWKDIRSRILPELASFSTINIWHAGCSTGQEVYSMLILLNESGLLDKARVLATDINSDVLESASSGVYRYRFNKGYLDNFDKVITSESHDPYQKDDLLYSKYFTVDKDKDTITIHPFLREKPVFKKHDLVSREECYPGKFDLIICRNVVIYFNYTLQSRIFELFSNKLHPGGFLVIGIHETLVDSITDRFNKSGYAFRKQVEFGKMI